MNNVSTAAVELPAPARTELMELLASTKRFALVRVTKAVEAFDLMPGDELYIEMVEPKEGKVAVTCTGQLERYSGQSGSFGVVRRFEGRAIH